MPGCFVYGCKTGYKGQSGFHIFGVPTPAGKKFPDPTIREAWITKLKRVRSDVTFDPTNKGHKVCSLHFRETDIVKEDTFIIQGDKVTIPRLKWRLTDSAVPSVFDSIPSHMMRKSPKKRRNPEERRVETVEKKRKLQEKYSIHNVSLTLTPNTEDAENEIPTPLDSSVLRYQDISMYFQNETDWELRMQHNTNVTSLLHYELRDSFHIAQEVQVRIGIKIVLYV